MALDDIKGIMIGTILAMIVIGGGIYFMGTLFAYDTSLDSPNQIGDFTSALNKSTEMTNSVNDMETSLSVSEKDVGLLGWLNNIVGSVYKGLKTLYSEMSFIKTTINIIGNLFGVPSFVIGLLALIISIIIIIAIWSAITKT